MRAYYGKFIDKLIPQKMETMLRLGRRSEEDRRLIEEDRRIYADDNYLVSESERRNSEMGRRGPVERRERWFRINHWQSRHV